MTNGRNEFPVRLDERALMEIANKTGENAIYVKVNHVLPRIQADQQSLRQALAAILALQEYLKERHVDPGFQVVISE